MAKQIMQFRYYGEGQHEKEKNQPSNTMSAEALRSGSVFTPFLPFTQLGIQTWPGTHFYLNNAETPIIVGQTGIYELELEGISEITNIQFDYDSIQRIETNPNAYIIIDVICDVLKEE